MLDADPRLEPGVTIGPYRIEALIGSGGMGEVYRARDTRLERSVAVKVLPRRVAVDPGYKQRLEREAKALAALSHPRICPVFDIGQQDGIDYLVMEYVEGETLAKRLTKGALPLNQALRCAVEIADALDKAHAQRIVHRDLKPGNIMLTKGGARLLDFGLATQRPDFRPAPGSGDVTALAESPTERSSLMGTLQYMAPEQFAGEPADARSDIFAFGAVIYEMVTGRKAFDGQSQASIVHAILEREPLAVSTLAPTSPPAVDHLIRACLSKDPDRRWQSAGDIGRSLTWLLAEDSAPRADAPKATGWRRGLRPVATLLGAVGIAVGAWLLGRTQATHPWPVLRLDYPLPEGHELRNAERSVLAFSATGGEFVYNTTKGLLLRSLRESDARLIPGTEEDLSNPFLSPDGQWVGYFASGQLKKVSASGGTPIPLCGAEPPYGASWSADDTIVFGQSRGVMRVAASGGVPTLVVPAQAGELLDGPELLPGGRALVFGSTPVASRPANAQRWDEAQILVQRIASGERKSLWRGGSSPRYVATGHLVYAVKDSLFALPFDPETLTTSGHPVQLVSGVHRAPTPWLQAGYASYGVSDRGTLVYLRSEEIGQSRVLGLVDRQGVVQRIDIPPGPYMNPRLSPDGRRLLVQTRAEDGRTDVWVYELSGDRQIRQLTMDGRSRYPLWTPDGTRATFVSSRDGQAALYWQRIDGHAAERLTPPLEQSRPDSWSPDGTILVLRSARGEDIGISTLRPGGRDPEPYYDLPGSMQYEASFSPDGKWLAYTSTETGADEVFVQPFPATGAKVRVTQRGGGFPIWSPDGRELFYRRSFDRTLNRTHDARLFAVDITTTGGVVALGPERVLPLEGFMVFNTYRDYDIARDNKRFLMVYPSKRLPEAPRITVVQNWFEELRARVPVR